jgi:hypothetical protein
MVVEMSGASDTLCRSPFDVAGCEKRPAFFSLSSCFASILAGVASVAGRFAFWVVFDSSRKKAIYLAPRD